MKQIAYIGLGIMGRPMAINLVKAGHQVTGFNRSPQKTQLFVESGGRGSSSIAEAVADADVIFTNVPDAPDVAAVLGGKDGVFAHAKSGAFWVDNSTISTAATKEFAAEAEIAGLKPVDAPVSGGEAGAINATLSIMVGASKTDFEDIIPVLSALGNNVVHVGDVGSGQTVKAANQLIVAGNIQLLAEALNFLEACKVDTNAALKAMSGGMAGSKVMEAKGTNMMHREYTPGFRLELHNKDLGIALAAARESGAFMPTSNLVAQLVAAAVAQGNGSLDHSALLKNVQDLSKGDR